VKDSTLRKYIRTLILEDPQTKIPDEELQIDDQGLSVDQRAFGGYKRDLMSSLGISGSEASREDQKGYSISGRKDPTTMTRVKLKDQWNDRVYSDYGRTNHARQEIRSQFWRLSSENEKLEAVHWLGLVEDREADVLHLLTEHFKRETSSSRTAELSAIGYYRVSPVQGQVACGLKLNGRVTFAYNGDAYTEHLNSATKEIKDFHSGSGLPKRANTHLNSEQVIYGEQDLERMGINKIGELTIDNYSIQSVYLNSRSPKKLKRKIKKLCDLYNYKVTEY